MTIMHENKPIELYELNYEELLSLLESKTRKFKKDILKAYELVGEYFSSGLRAYLYDSFKKDKDTIFTVPKVINPQIHKEICLIFDHIKHVYPIKFWYEDYARVNKLFSFNKGI